MSCRNHSKRVRPMLIFGILAITCLDIPFSHAVGKGHSHHASTRIAHEWRQVIKEGCDLPPNGDTPKASEKSEDASNSTAVRLAPLPHDTQEWHFSFSGVPGSPYEGGIYHGRFLLPQGYPRLAPRVQMLTPSGRFACRSDICLSASNYHQDSWSTHWSLHKLTAALRLHMLTRPHEIGGEWSERVRNFILVVTF